jgi:hypothetical protein
VTIAGFSINAKNLRQKLAEVLRLTKSDAVGETKLVSGFHLQSLLCQSFEFPTRPPDTRTGTCALAVRTGERVPGVRFGFTLLA